MADWSTYQGNAKHNGYVDTSVAGSAISFLWSHDFGAQLNPPAIANGQIFTSQQARFRSGHPLVAMDVHTGAEIWNHPDFGSVNSINPPAYANGKVYIQTGKGTTSNAPYLYAFDATDGSLVYRSTFSAQWESYYAPTIYDGDVYINGGYYGGSYRFDGNNGNQRWFHDLPQYDDWTPAVDQDYVYAYVGEYSPGLYVLNRQTGARLFSIPDPNFDWSGWSMNLAPVITDDGDVIAIHDGRLISFDVDGRRIGWESQRSYKGQPVIVGDVIYAIDAGTLTAVDASDGTFLKAWDPPAGVSVSGNMIATNSHLFVQSPTTTYMLDIGTFDIAWSYEASGSIALGDDHFAIADGTVLHTFTTVPEPTSLVVLGCTGLLVAGRAWRPPHTESVTLGTPGGATD